MRPHERRIIADRGADAAEERGGRRPARAARRHPGARGRGLVPRARLPPRRRTRIRETSGPVAQLALDGKAKELPGIGKTIEEKIVQIVDDGEIHALTKHKALVPAEVVRFTRLPGLGPKTARRIWKELGVTTVAGLQERGRGGAAARAARARREERGEDPRGAEGRRRGAEAGRRPAAARRRPARGARGRRGAARASGGA